MTPPMGCCPAWRPDELDRRRIVECGGSVVAHLYHDKALVAWARGGDVPPIKADREWHRGVEVYVGRAMPWHRPVKSPWCNPFNVKEHGREAAIALYRERLLVNPDLLARLSELRGRVLTCWCHPEPCHGNVLLELLAGVEP